MGSLTCLERVFTKLLRPNVYKYGKCLGKESQNGIKVYESFEKNGNRVLTSLKNGELYKTTEIREGMDRNEWLHCSTAYHNVVVKNHEAGTIFDSYKGTTKYYDGTRDEFRGTTLNKPNKDNVGELEKLETCNRYRGDQLINEYNTKISKDGTLYRYEDKRYNDLNELDHVRLELTARNYKMPNGQIVNYGRTQHFLPKNSYSSVREKEVRYLEPTWNQIELTPNGVNQFDPSWMKEYKNNFSEKPVFLKG